MSGNLQLAWRAHPQLESARAAGADLARRIGVEPVIGALLVERGLGDPGSASEFLRPTTASVPDPFRMKGMRETADRVRRAVQAGERILVFGDYDADGIPGTAMLGLWLRKAGAKVTTMIPPRESGYGLGIAHAKAIAARADRPALVITVDCGTSDHESVRYLQGEGIDVVVTDHHLVLNGPPPTPWFINPARPDETYPFRYLCGCGVAYKLITALSTRTHEEALYDFVAVSTIGDMVSLTGENRYYVKEAIAGMRGQQPAASRTNLGIGAILREAGVNLASLTADDIGWRVCPRINAVGRMGADENLVVELLQTSDASGARALAGEVDRHNRARKEVTDRLVAEAIRGLGSDPGDVVVAYLPDAVAGVAGLIAGKLMDHYGRPALVVNADGRGSGRAPEWTGIMPIMDELRRAGVFGARRARDGSSIVADFGGHAQACGFHNVDPGALRSAAARIRLDRQVLLPAFEGDLTLAAATPTLVAQIAQLGPFGMGNPEPALRFRGLTVVETKTMGEGRHLALELAEGDVRMRAVWWGAGDLASRMPARVDLLAMPFHSGFSGRVELTIRHARAAA